MDKKAGYTLLSKVNCNKLQATFELPASNCHSKFYDIPFLNEINNFIEHKPFCGTENTVEWWLAKVGRFPFDSSMSRRGTYFGSWGDFFAPIQYVLL